MILCFSVNFHLFVQLPLFLLLLLLAAAICAIVQVFLLQIRGRLNTNMKPSKWTIYDIRCLRQSSSQPPQSSFSTVSRFLCLLIIHPVSHISHFFLLYVSDCVSISVCVCACAPYSVKLWVHRNVFIYFNTICFYIGTWIIMRKFTIRFANEKKKKMKKKILFIHFISWIFRFETYSLYVSSKSNV